VSTSASHKKKLSASARRRGQPNKNYPLIEEEEEEAFILCKINKAE